MKADSIVAISGGTISLAVTGDDSEGIRARHTVAISGGHLSIVVIGHGSKAIKGRRYTEDSTVLNGGFVHISGGEGDIHVLGEGLADGQGGTTPCVGISTDADFSMTGGEFFIEALGLETLPLEIAGSDNRSDGTITIARAPWRTNAFNYPYDMTAYVVVHANGVPVSNYGNKAIGAFIGEECVGYGMFDNTSYGIMRIRNHSTAQQAVTFKVYDYATSKEYAAQADRDVSFISMASIGTPSSPIVLSYTPRGLLGDVNLDGDVNITDVTLIVNYILHNDTEHFHIENADLDGSNDINITDVTLVIDIILGGG